MYYAFSVKPGFLRYDWFIVNPSKIDSQLRPGDCMPYLMHRGGVLSENGWNQTPLCTVVKRPGTGRRQHAGIGCVTGVSEMKVELNTRPH